MHRVRETFPEHRSSINENSLGPVGEDHTRASRVTIIEFRGLEGDLLLHALLQAAPECRINLVRKIADAPAGPEQVVVYSFVSRCCDLDTLESALSRLRERFSTSPLVILTEAFNSELKTLMDRFRVDFWVPATSGFEALIDAVRSAAVQHTTNRRQEAFKVGEIMGANAPTASERLALTTRERLILRLVHEGKSNKLIAHELGCSESTVKVHISNMMRKLRLRNRTQLALIYQEREAETRKVNNFEYNRGYVGLG